MINDKFIIIGDATPITTNDNLTTFKQSGIDTFVLYPNEQDHYGAIERCKDADLNVFIFGGSTIVDENKKYFPYGINDFPNYFRRYIEEDVDLNKYKNVTGLYMIDEPSAKFFDKINEIYVPWFNDKFASKKMWHINLLPSYATQTQLGVTPEKGLSIYETYVKEFANKVLLNVKGVKSIGVDHYALKCIEGVYQISEDFLLDYAIIGDYARKTNSIFSTCIQTFSDGPLFFTDTTQDIRFQFYTALAFGASMFEIYAYSNMHGTKALVLDGVVTTMYYAVRDAIRELRSIEKVFLQYKWKGIKTFCPLKKPVEFEKIEKYELNLIDGIKNVKVSQNTIISLFDKDGKTGYLLLNYGIARVSGYDLVEIDFVNAKRITVYQFGREDKRDLSDGKISFYLEPGQGVFVTVDD